MEGLLESQQVTELEQAMQQVIATLRTMHTTDHPVTLARKRDKAIEQIEDLRSELHLLQIELEDGESVAEAMRRML